MANVVNMPGAKIPQPFADMRANLDMAIESQWRRVQALDTEVLEACQRYHRLHEGDALDATLTLADDLLLHLIDTELQSRGKKQ